MSSKSTLLLTDTEHWYLEHNGQSNNNSRTDTPLVLEFGPEHKVLQGGLGTTILIEEGTQLFSQLNQLFSHP